VAGSWVVDAIAAGPSEPLQHSAWPAFSLLRLGCVVAIAALLAAATARVPALPPIVRTLASETLFLYVSHLLVLYVAGIGLARILGPTLPLGAAAAIAITLIVLCSAVALTWSRWKARAR
ncbi:MAG: hypothetical protein M3Y87_30605, partial [Myxococcota bacterium]|nr:hypothetical protein [Myxococcota bacterium]